MCVLEFQKLKKNSSVDLLTVIKHLDQFFHLIPIEKNECVMNTYVQFSQEKYLSVQKARSLHK